MNGNQKQSVQGYAPVGQVIPYDPHPLLQSRFGDGKPDACMLAAMSGVGKVHGLNALYREHGLIMAVAVVASALASAESRVLTAASCEGCA